MEKLQERGEKNECKVKLRDASFINIMVEVVERTLVFSLCRRNVGKEVGAEVADGNCLLV